MDTARQHNASEVGLQVIEDGENAIDIAVAAKYTLAINPYCGNIDLGSFISILS